MVLLKLHLWPGRCSTITGPGKMFTSGVRCTLNSIDPWDQEWMRDGSPRKIGVPLKKEERNETINVHWALYFSPFIILY
jgi:hypothetical protein